MGLSKANCEVGLLIISFLFTSTIQQSAEENRTLYRDRPKLLTRDAHLVFLAGERSNIFFNSTNGGAVFVDDFNIKVAMTQTSTNKNNIAGMKRTLKAHQEFMDSTHVRVGHLMSRLPEVPSIPEIADQLDVMKNRLDAIQKDTKSTTNEKEIEKLKKQVSLLKSRMREIKNALNINECRKNPCRNGGTCLDGYNGYYCQCPREWTGRHCTEDMDECALFVNTPLGCQNEGKCVNTAGGFRCECLADWYGVRCQAQSDSCSAASHQEMCGHGTCIDVKTPGSGQPHYKCVCDEGWTNSTDSGPACISDIDECNSQNKSLCSISPSVKCINTPGSFHCGICPAGYVGNGFVCTDVEECAYNNGGCSTLPKVDCHNTIGSRICGPCPDGFVGDGIHCEWVGLCHLNNGGCHPKATCNRPREPPCTCPEGYSGSGEGQDGCVSNSKLAGCVSSPCKNGGSCQPVGTHTFKCECADGYLGFTCETLPDPCDKMRCGNGGKCKPSNDKKYAFCVCLPPYTGFSCELKKRECGGPLIGEIGELRYPLEPGVNSSHSVSCAWTITTHPHKVLLLIFREFSIAPKAGRECKTDSLAVYDGPTTSSPLKDTYCGSNRPPFWMYSSYNSIHLWFRSDHTGGSQGFRLSWTSSAPECGRGFRQLSVSRSSGTIFSPGYPSRYPAHRDCVWTVFIHPGSRVSLKLSDLDLGRDNSCNGNYLEIRDGQTENHPVLRRFCTTIKAHTIHTSGPFALIRFHSGPTRTGQAFKIEFAADSENRQGCGGFLKKPHGQLQTPRYPGPVPYKAVCVWLIELSRATYVELTFSEFDMGACNHSYVRIRDGGDQRAPSLGDRLCKSPGTVKSRGRMMLIELHTDGDMRGLGFQASYKTACSRNFKAGYLRYFFLRFIDSPWHLKNYELTCVYTVTAARGNSVGMWFYTRMKVSSVYSCNNTYLEFFNGPDIYSPHLPPKVCHYQRPLMIESTSSSLTIKYRSDTSNNYLFFRAVYFAVYRRKCPLKIHGNKGDLSTEGTKCRKWFITSSPDTNIKLYFSYFNVTGSKDQCGSFSLLVRLNTPKRYNVGFLYVHPLARHVANSYSTEGNVYKKFCGQDIPEAVLFPYNMISLEFQTSSSANIVQEFSASFVALNVSVCGGRLTHLSGSIETPNYPDPHPQDMNCVWTISVPEGHQVRLTVMDFQLESSLNCSIDYLEIRDGNFSDSPLLGKFCSKNLEAGAIIYATGTSFYLNFVSTSYYFGFEKGFKIDYDSGATGCGGMLSTATGGFQSPHYPQKNPRDSECFWTITVSEGNTLTLLFDHMELESDKDCSVQYVEVRDTDITGALLGRFCNKSATLGAVTSVGNSLWVKYRSRSSYTGAGFSAHYRINCSLLTFQSRAGVIESPNYPESYPYRVGCIWNIQAPLGNRLKLHIVGLKFEKTKDNKCGPDSLKVTVDAASDATRSSTTFCGYYPSRYIESDGRNASLQLVSDGLLATEGFRLEWQVIGCGGDLTERDGTLQLPENLSKMPRHCEWTITVPFGRKIQLQINQFDLTCENGALEIYAGRNREGPRLINHCHSLASPLTVASPSHTMFVFLHYSDYSPKFKASYTSKYGGCGGKLTAYSGILLSENHNSQFPPNTECEWLLEVQEDHVVRLTVNVFDMNTDQYCNTSYVKIYNGRDASAPLIQSSFCRGQTYNVPTSLKSKNNLMFVQLRTGDTKSSYVFNATYTTTCGAVLDADQGGSIFANPAGTQECVWYIASKQNRKVSITVLKLSCENDEQLYITDGLDSTAELQAQKGPCQIPPTFYSQGSTITVKLVTKGHTTFRADYSSAADACGGSYTATSSNFHGEIISPWYPDVYPNYLECLWELKPLPGNGFVLSFTNVDLAGGINDDYIEIRSPGVDGKIVDRLYGSETVFTKTFTSKAWIKFRTNEKEAKSGFTALWGPSYKNYLTENQGKINFVDARKSRSYRWFITVDKSLIINMTVFFSCTSSSNSLKIYNENAESADMIFHQRHSMSEGKILLSSTNQIEIVVYVADYLQLLVSWEAVISEEKIPGCGGILQALESLQNLTSPGYPNNYPNNLDCRWLIKSPLSSTVVLNITYVDIESHGPTCLYADYVEILDVGSLSRRSLGQYCGREVPTKEIKSSHHTVEVHFKSDKTRNFTGFVMTYTIGCGGILQTSDARIYSPNYPEQYPPNQNCSWQVSALPGRTLLLDFEQDFNIAGETSISENSTCSGDYLQLFNGKGLNAPPLIAANSSSLDGRYCGTASPRSTRTGSSYLTAKFVSDSSGCGSGFSFNVSEMAVGCGGHLTLTYEKPSGYFASPNYPDNYTKNLDCIWIIRAPPTREIQVDFVGSFEVHDSKGCMNNSLFFLDGGTESSKTLGEPLCGNSLPNTVTSTGNFLYARFITNNTVTGKGFKAKYYIGRCGGRLWATLTPSSLFSPDLKGKHTATLRCKWVITGPVGHFLSINITRLNLHRKDECNSTSLQILDPYAAVNATVDPDSENRIEPERNPDDTRGILFQGCSLPRKKVMNHELQVHSFDALSHLAQITFWPDFSSRGNVFVQDFEIQYKASYDECGGFLTLRRGSISSPNYPRQYNHRRECIWDIQVEMGRSVTLIFKKFEFLGSSHNIDSSCNIGNYIEMKNGLYGDSVSIGRYCGNLPHPVSSSGNTMRVIYRLAALDSSARFMAVYNSDSFAKCGGLLNKKQGTITVCDKALTDNLECEWMIHSPSPNVTINVKWRSSWFDSRKIGLRMWEGVERNLVGDLKMRKVWYWHRLDIARGGRVRHYYQHLSFNFPFTQLSLRSRINRKQSCGGRKIMLDFKINDCGGVLSEPEGVVTLNFTKNDTLNCAWLIRPADAEGHVIKISFPIFSVKSCTSYVKILNGGDFLSPLFNNKYCGSTKPPKLTSSTNQLRISFVSFKPLDGEFQFQYTTLSKGCTFSFHKQTGHFHTPRVKGSYPHNTQCQWTINVEKGFYVKLQFNNLFDLEAGNCTKDFVMVYDFTNGGTTRRPLGTWCGNKTPPSLSSSSSKMMIVFQSDSQTNGHGFSAKWQAACGALIQDRSFRSTKYPHYENNMDCLYTLLPEKDTVSLRVYADMQGGTGCPHDFVTIYTSNSTTDRAIQVAKLCGRQRRRFLLHGNISLVFKTDHTRTGRGFYVSSYSYNSICRKELPVYYWIFNDMISSLYYFLSFPVPEKKINCSTLIFARGNGNVLLRYGKMNIPVTPHCMDYYLEIYDGTNASAPLLHKLCGSNFPRTVMSSSKYLYTRYVAPHVEAHMGYQFFPEDSYGIKRDIHQQNGTLTCGRVRFCQWNLEVDVLKVISLFFQRISCQFLRVYDGPASDRHVLYEEFEIHYKRPSKLVKSTRNKMTVEVYTYFDVFQADFKQLDDLCPDTQLNATSSSQLVKFSASNSTVDLPLGCMWTVDAGADSRHIILDYSGLNLAQSCDSDYLLVQDDFSYGRSDKICDSKYHESFYSRGRKIKIVYNQFEASNVSTFELRYRLAECSKNYSNSAGKITNLGFPDSFSLDSDCILQVSSPEGTFLALYFVVFDMGSKNQCLEVMDNSKKLCGKITPSPVFLSSNTASLKIPKNGQTDVVYDIFYVASNTISGCGGNLTDVFPGVLTNPEYPSVPDKSLDCVWKLSVTSGKIHISIDTLLMPEKPVKDCSVSSLQIGSQVFCTESNEKFINSNKAELTVRYRSTKGSPAVKFLVQIAT